MSSMPGSSTASPRATSRARLCPSSGSVRSSSCPEAARSSAAAWRRSQISMGCSVAEQVSLRRMALEPGEQVGPYEVLAPLARGGMGEIYRARDTRLRREVALKLLPDASAHDADSLRRFDRETHAVAALNHPNILAIHDSGTHRGVPYAVTELLQGETLAERLRTGALAEKRGPELRRADG